MTISFAGQTAIVTGAGNGLGRSHALELARRGANLIINDPGKTADGQSAAQAVASEICDLGGNAIANTDSVTDLPAMQAMVQSALSKWGRIDVLINNAGVLRDKSFGKMEMDDFALVIDVHLIGSVNCTKSVWDAMREQKYGRVALTTSISGLHGNFGQANYGAAKAAMVGLMNCLDIEGAKYNIHVNCLSPVAATGMTTGMIPKDLQKLMSVDAVSAGLAYLVSTDAPSRMILCAGAGSYTTAGTFETQGIYLPPDQQTAENIADNIDRITDTQNAWMPQEGPAPSHRFGEIALSKTTPEK